MTLDELMERAPKLRQNGVLRVRVGDLEVHFAPLNHIEALVKAQQDGNGANPRDDALDLEAWSMSNV